MLVEVTLEMVHKTGQLVFPGDSDVTEHSWRLSQMHLLELSQSRRPILSVTRGCQLLVGMGVWEGREGQKKQRREAEHK